MTKKFFYTGLDEARRRLENSVILYDKEPYYVRRVVYRPAKGAVPELREGARTDFGWLVPIERVLAGDREACEYVWRQVEMGRSLLRHNDENGNRVYTVQNAAEVRRRIADYHNRLREAVENGGDGHVPDPVPSETLWFQLSSISNRDESTKEVRQTDPKVDLTSPRLGMMNSPDGLVFFIERAPVRRAAQGLNNNNINRRILPGLLQDDGGHPGGARFDLQFSPELAQTIRGEYPPYHEALAALFGFPGPAGRAISRDFAITKENLDLVYLVYRMQKIAWSQDGRSFNLNRGMDFAREQLNQLGVKINAAA